MRMSVKVNFLIVLSLFFSITNIVAQQSVKGEGFDIFKADWSSLSHKTKEISVSKPITIRFKAMPDLFLEVGGYHIDGKEKPRGSTKEISRGLYEVTIIPQAIGISYVLIVGDSDELYEEKGIEEEVIVQYKLNCTALTSIEDHVKDKKVKIPQQVYDLGFKDDYLPSKNTAIKTTGQVLQLDFKSPDSKLIIGGQPEGLRLSIAKIANGVDSVHSFRITCKEPGWHKVEFSFYSYALSEEEEEKEYDLVNYWLYFPEVVDSEQQQKQYMGSIPTHEDHLQDEKYNYSRIDKLIKDIPENQNKTIRSITNYIEQNARNTREKIRAVFIWEQKFMEYTKDEKYCTTSPDLIVEDVRQSICAGYAAVFKGFMDLMNIKSLIVGGYVLDNRFTPEKPGRHAWNVVALDGKWRVLDATWGEFFEEPTNFVFSHFPTYINNLPFKTQELATNAQALKNPISEKEWKARDFSKLVKDEEVSLHQGLVAHYTFDGTRNNVEGANYVHDQKTAQYGVDRFGSKGKVIKLSGNNGFEIDGQSLDDFSFSAWIFVPKSMKEGYKYPILTLPDNEGTPVFQFVLDYYYPIFRQNKSNTESQKYRIVGSQYRKGRWQHVVVVKKGSTVSMYVNMKKAKSAELETNRQYSKKNLVVGELKNNEFLLGLDDLRIYNRALTSEEVNKLYYEKGFKGKVGDHY